MLPLLSQPAASQIRPINNSMARRSELLQLDLSANRKLNSAAAILDLSAADRKSISSSRGWPALRRTVKNRFADFERNVFCAEHALLIGLCY